MKYLVVGTLPPPALGRSAALLAEVTRLEAEGHEVTVRPIGVGDPASRLSGLLARLGLDTLVMLATAHDRAETGLVLQIEPALVGAGAGRARRAVLLCLLAAALSGWENIEVRVDSFADLPNGLGGRAAALVWKRADRVVVSSLELAEAVAVAGVAEVSSPAAASSALLEDWPPDSDDPDLQQVLAVVRQRAARERERSGRHPDDAAAQLSADASGTAAARSPYGPLEPLIRFAYERPALRDPIRKVRHAIRRR